MKRAPDPRREFDRMCAALAVAAVILAILIVAFGGKGSVRLVLLS